MDMSDSDTDEPWHNAENREPRNHVVIVNHNSICPWNKESGGITTLYKCEASEARCLYIFDGTYKLLKSDQYDIGGAYQDDLALWFYFTTSVGPSRNYLMNLFVCQRKPGLFSLGISDSNMLTTTIHNNDKVRALSKKLDWKNFNSSLPDEVHHITTFCFSEEDRVSLEKFVLVIPISIKMSTRSVLNKDVVQKIRSEYEFGEELLKNLKPEFLLISSEGKEYKIHKIVLAAHSPVLRDLIRANECKTLNLDITNNEMELLLQYLYTGVIKDILNQPLELLLVMADRFQLQNLRELVQHAMKLSVCSENAIDMAVIGEKYNCKDVQESAFQFIAKHPEVLNTDAFSQINNANIVKKLLKFIHVKAS